MPKSLEVKVEKELEQRSVEVVLQEWVREWKASRALTHDNLFVLLSNMYEIYKQIMADGMPALEPAHVATFSQALQRLRGLAESDANFSKYRFVLLQLQRAYDVTRTYAILVHGNVPEERDINSA